MNRIDRGSGLAALPMRSCVLRFVLLPALIAAGLLWAAMRTGMPMNPDGWIYWEGAVSLAESGGYRFLDGEEIAVFPPVYSALLAAVSTLSFGFCGRSLLLASVLLCFVNALLACGLVVIYGRARNATLLAASAACACVAVYLPIASADLRAEQLSRVCVAAAALVLASLALQRGSAGRANTRGETVLVAALVLSLTLAVCAKNSLLAFVPATALALYVIRPSGWRRTAVLALVLPVLAWIVLRSGFSQGGSHAIDAGLGIAALLRRASEALSGFGKTMGLEVAGQVLLCLMFWRSVAIDRQLEQRAARGLLALGLCYVAGLVALFAIVQITDPLSRRFLFAIVIMLVPLGLIDTLSERRHVGLQIVLALCVLAPPASKALRNAVRGKVRSAAAAHELVPLSHYLGSEAPPGAVVVKPPPAPWRIR